MGLEYEAAARLAPELGKISVIAVTTSSGTPVDLSAAAQLGSLATAGHYLTFRADGGKVWFFVVDSATGTVDETATTGNNRAYVLSDGESQDYLLPVGCTYVVAKGSVACKLRIFPSSKTR